MEPTRCLLPGKPELGPPHEPGIFFLRQLLTAVEDLPVQPRDIEHVFGRLHAALDLQGINARCGELQHLPAQEEIAAGEYVAFDPVLTAGILPEKAAADLGAISPVS